MSEVNLEEKKYHILFVCSGNSVRSQLAEAIASTISHGRFIAYSAGAKHKDSDSIHPLVYELTNQMGYHPDNMFVQDWNDFAQPDAQKMDFVITLCDDSKNETAPLWLGDPVTAHWSFPNPTKVKGSDEEVREIFKQVELGLRSRIEMMLELPLNDLDDLAIHHEINKLGSIVSN